MVISSVKTPKIIWNKRLKKFMKFSELVRLLEQNGSRIIKEKGSIRYYWKPGVDRLIRVE